MPYDDDVVEKTKQQTNRQTDKHKPHRTARYDDRRAARAAHCVTLRHTALHYVTLHYSLLESLVT